MGECARSDPVSAEKFAEARLYAEAIEFAWAHRDQINSLLTRIQDGEMRDRAQRGYLAALETGVDQGLRNYDQTKLLMSGLFPNAEGDPQAYIARRSVAS